MGVAWTLFETLFLKELYVNEAARGTGVGTMLMRSLAEIAIKRHCSRLEWHAERSNVDAQSFYAHLDVPVRDSKLVYRAQGETLRQLANRR